VCSRVSRAWQAGPNTHTRSACALLEHTPQCWIHSCPIMCPFCCLCVLWVTRGISVTPIAAGCEHTTVCAYHGWWPHSFLICGPPKVCVPDWSHACSAFGSALGLSSQVLEPRLVKYWSRACIVFGSALGLSSIGAAPALLSMGRGFGLSSMLTDPFVAATRLHCRCRAAPAVPQGPARATCLLCRLLLCVYMRTASAVR
jgi:hypothetical protein